MKKILFSLVAALAVGIFSESFAAHTLTSNPNSGDDSFRAKVVVRPESMKLDVFVEPTENNHLKISFLDTEGRMLATQRVGSDETIKGVRFDISELKDGIYQVEITDGTTKQVENVEVGTSLQRSLSLE